MTEELFWKQTNFSGFSSTGPHIMPMDMMDYTLIKQAAGELHPEIDKYIRNAKPIPGKSILLIDAMGAGEYWGSNSNGDYFSVDQLAHEGSDYGHKTFMIYAYPYKHHQNEAMKKDPKRRYGDKVALSVYHEPMHRVQLIVVVNNNQCTDILDAIEGGSYPDVSMACGVKYDQCSYCGSIHRTRRDYCEHAKYMLNKTFNDGKKVYLYNHHPRFHDISFVLIGAEKGAKTLLKIASPYNLNIHFEANPMALDILNSYVRRSVPEQKSAIIKKQITLESPDVVVVKPEEQQFREQLSDLLVESEPRMEKNVLDTLAKFPLQDVIETLLTAGIIPDQEDFQYLVASMLDGKDLAQECEDKGIIFDEEAYGPEDIIDLPEGKSDPTIMVIIKDEIPKKSCYLPWIAQRDMRFQKQAGVMTNALKSVMKWPVVAGLYSKFTGYIPNKVSLMMKQGYNSMAPFLPEATNSMAMNAGWALGREVANNMEESPETSDYWASIAPDPQVDSFWKQSSAVMDILKSPISYGVASLPLFYLRSKMKKAKLDMDEDVLSPESETTPTDIIIAKHPLASSALGGAAVAGGIYGIKRLFTKKANAQAEYMVWDYVRRRVEKYLQGR